LSDSLEDYFRSRRSLVDDALGEQLRPREGLPESLREAMRYSLLAPGKRLRPMLALLACEACGGNERQALPAACAVEMVHTYSLVHDDLPAMDDDDLRRGRPTCHKQFGEALAILAGDALLTLAFEVLAAGMPPRSAAACCRELAVGAGACGMVGGQVDDLASEGRLARVAVEGSESPLADLELLHARKTGALFRAALRMGAWAAHGERDGEPPALGLLDGYGRCFGQAFQITDDLFDVEGSAEQTGKRVQKDAGRGKLTYPGLLGVAESRRRAEALCAEACRLLEPLGAAGERLARLARFVVERDR
jgi:geranylgeranyl diphosphate synthase type II